MGAETLPKNARHDLAVLDDILVDVNGSRTAYEAAAQAASLAGAKGRVTLLAVTAVAGTGRYRTAAFAPARAERSLAHARRLVEAAEVSVLTEIDERGPVAEVLLEHAAGHGVLAVGPPPMSRVSHLLLGGTATMVAHLLPASLLVARRPPPRTVFGGSMIVASDALGDSTGLVHFATALARRHDATLTLVHALHGESSLHPTRLAAQVEYVMQALGERASVRIEPGRAHDLIVETGKIERATLLIVSSRRVGGLRALGSVSERVVHDASCSVLVMRPEDINHVAVGH